ncbi:MAG: acyltransferase [bacterium]|nr:acyltransferase [bacterium]
MRKHYLDNIRWTTVVLVVIYHMFYMYNSVQPFGVIGPFSPVQYQDAFLYLVYPWFMIILFAVSGVSTRYYLENHSHKEYIKSRTVKLLVPSTIGVLVFHWILGYYNLKIGGSFDTMGIGTMPKPVAWVVLATSGIGVLWYVQLLWVFALLIVVIRKIEKDRLYHLCEKCGIVVLLVLTPFVYLAAQVLNTPVITVYRFGIYGLCFLIGYFVLSHECVMERLEKFACPLSIAAIALGIAYTVLYFGENYAAEPAINCPLACVFGWIAVLAIFAVMKKWGDRTSPLAQWMSKKSWGLYIFHYVPLAMVAYYLSISEVKLPVIVYYLAVLVAEFAGGYLLNEIISRIPILRWCVLGISKKKKESRDV